MAESVGCTWLHSGWWDSKERLAPGSHSTRADLCGTSGHISEWASDQVGTGWGKRTGGCRRREIKANEGWMRWVPGYISGCKEKEWGVVDRAVMMTWWHLINCPKIFCRSIILISKSKIQEALNSEFLPHIWGVRHLAAPCNQNWHEAVCGLRNLSVDSPTLRCRKLMSWITGCCPRLPRGNYGIWCMRAFL